jgi:PPK2 family polyphosphate:nucleotide phosphotransferase
MSGASTPPSLTNELRVAPGTTVDLGTIDPGATYGYTKETAKPKARADLDRLTSLQERLWADRDRRVLIVLQGIDTSGKDGTIIHVFDAFNPQGCRVANFGVPSPVELAHDYLWRIHAQTPANGEIVIFNRSHYESVLVERVHELVPKATWAKRYDHINAFERLLTDEGTTIVKFFLWIDKAEQLERLRARYEDPTKRWKFNVNDLEERKLWDDYTAAFQDAVSRCSTETAPWYVIPANKKWFRDVAVGEILADTLDGLHIEYPKRDDLPKKVDFR